MAPTYPDLAAPPGPDVTDLGPSLLVPTDAPDPRPAILVHATADDAGQRADGVLGRRVPQLSPRVARALALAGHLRVDGRPAPPSQRVHAGARLELLLPSLPAEIERFNNLNVGLLNTRERQSYVTECLSKTQGPIVSATDYIKLYSDQIRPFIPKGRSYVCLGTDGFGRSDTRETLRHHFEFDRNFIAYTAIKALVDEGVLEVACAEKALILYSIHSDKPDPAHA